MKKLILYTDGGSKGNPGDAATGFVITTEDGMVKSRMDNVGSNPIDLGLLLGELELIKLQILTLIQGNRKSQKW